MTTTDVDLISSKISKVNINDINFNNTDDIPLMINMALSMSTDDEIFQKLITKALASSSLSTTTTTTTTTKPNHKTTTVVGSAESEVSQLESNSSSKFLHQFRDELKDYDNMYKFIVKLESIYDHQQQQQKQQQQSNNVINDLLNIINKDDVLINTVLKINKELLKTTAASIFQLTLLLSIITNYSVINKAYFTNLTIVLPYMNQNDKIRSIIMLIIIKLNEIDSQLLDMTILNYLEDVILLDGDKVLLFDLLNYLFPILPSLSSFINGDENFKDLLINMSVQISELNESLINSILRFLATVSIDLTMRQYILQNYYPMLINSMKSTTTRLSTKVLISLVITKCWNYTEDKYDLSELLDVFVDAMLQDIDIDTDIEGLLYLSLQTKLKESIRSNVELITKLQSLLSQQNADNSVKFGVVTILINLSNYQDESDNNGFGPKMFSKEDTKDNDTQIDSFLQALINDGAIDKLISSVSKSSTNLKLQLIKLLSNFIYNKKHRSEVVKQGGLVVLLEFLVMISQNLQYDPETLQILNTDDMLQLETRIIACKSLLKILMNNNPNLIFGAKTTPQTCIPFLCELLTIDDSDKTVFELLIALINLSSLDDVSVKNLIIKISFDKLQDISISSNKQLSKTAIELIANLSISPILLEKFFAFDKPISVKNYELMLTLLNSIDIELQIATLNFFANVSEFEPICLLLIDEDKFINLIMDFFTNDVFLQNEEFVLRLVYILMNLCLSIQEKPSKLKNFKNNDLKNGLLYILQNYQDEELLTMCINICNIINFTN